MNYSIYMPVSDCEICGKPKRLKGLHAACSKVKQKMGSFKEVKVIPSRQRALAHGYEFLARLDSQCKNLRSDT